MVICYTAIVLWYLLSLVVQLVIEEGGKTCLFNEMTKLEFLIDV